MYALVTNVTSNPPGGGERSPLFVMRPFHNNQETSQSFLLRSDELIPLKLQKSTGINH